MNNRTLGTIAMVCAPAMLGFLIGGEDYNAINGIAGSIFMAGWICSNIGMQRVRAAGTGTWGRAVLLIQLVGLVLAFIFGFIEATALLGEDNIVFIVTDAAWPLSMVWMLVVGVTVIVAKRLPGWRRIVPVLCPLWLPISIIGDIAFGEVGGVIGIGFGAVLWTLLGYIVRNSGERVGASPEPAAVR